MHTCSKIDAMLTVTSDSEPPSARRHRQAGRRAASLNRIETEERRVSLHATGRAGDLAKHVQVC
jgi:hypothetical protein